LKSECPHIKQLLSGYVDGVLDAMEMNSIREHLKGCEGCSREYVALNSIISRLRNIKPVSTPDHFLKKINARIKEKDSILDRIRSILSFKRISFPVEAVAFAATAVMIIFLFSLFPDKEDIVMENLAKAPAGIVTGQGEQALQTAGNIMVEKLPAKDAVPVKTSVQQVNLALSLTAREDAPIPSRTASYGNSGSEHTTGEMDGWQAENDSAERIIQPDELNLRIDDILKSVEGRILTRKDNKETGYPDSLTMEIPAGNYSRFVSRMEDLGAISTPAPSLTIGPEDTRILIQMRLALPE
jgi:anti-sigma factor RsiW